MPKNTNETNFPSNLASPVPTLPLAVYQSVPVSVPVPDQAEIAQAVSTSTLIAAKTSQIKQLLRRTASDIQLIGQALIEVKAVLPYGKFREWLHAEFEWSERQAQRFMQVARAFAGVSLAGLPVMPSALYLLSAAGVSAAVREEALRRASLGDEISFAAAKELVANQLYTDFAKPPAEPEPVEMATKVKLETADEAENSELLEILPELQSHQFDFVIAGEIAGGDFSFVLGLANSETSESATKAGVVRAACVSQTEAAAQTTSTRLLSLKPGVTSTLLDLGLEKEADEDANIKELPAISSAPETVQIFAAPATATAIATETGFGWTGMRLSTAERAALYALKLSEVARLGIAKLETGCREQVVRLLLTHPQITGKKLRRLLSQLRQGESFEEARDEALGWVNGKPVYPGSAPETETFGFSPDSSFNQHQVVPGNYEEQLSILSQNLLTSATCTKGALAHLEAWLAPAGDDDPTLTLVQLQFQQDWIASLARLAESNLVEQLKVVLATRLLSKLSTPSTTSTSTSPAISPANYPDQDLQAKVLRFLQTF